MNFDIICFCHLRWNFVYQRPQHLLTRFARNNRVFVMEEPTYGASNNHVQVTKMEGMEVWIVLPHLVNGLDNETVNSLQQSFLDEVISSYNIDEYISWYYSPMALTFSNHLQPNLVVYDCMDELSAFNNAPSALTKLEQNLFDLADIVFTGGHNLFKTKKAQHSNIFPMPSSIDKEHFSKARLEQNDPQDQATIPHPRIGFYGVIDERLNINLLGEMATERPDWQFVLIGPVVKIDPRSLPQNSNIHYLGGKSYSQLPYYLSGWDVAMMPFALNRSTQFISPTKTPEYLAGGKPVVSTSITDVVDPYGNEGLVHIADSSSEFVDAIEKSLSYHNKEAWIKNVDKFLSGISWDQTWNSMKHLIGLTLESKKITHTKNSKVYV